MSELFTIPVLVASAGALVAAITDVRTFKVYNVLTVPLMASGMAYHGFTNGWAGLEQSLGGLLFGVGILLLPFLMGGMGAGDVKLLSAVGAWLGMHATFHVFLVSAFASGVCAIAMLVHQNNSREVVVRLQTMWVRFNSVLVHPGRDEWMQSVVPDKNPRQRVIPYGAMVALGILAVATC